MKTENFHSKIDFVFISVLEGSETKAYVPDPEGSESGITIASGFDLGQRSEEEIKNAFNDALCNKLLPYVGKKKQEACKYLQEHPLAVTHDELGLINQYSHLQAEAVLYKSWNNCDAAYTDFNGLSSECQTVVASVAFQYGNLRLKTPIFWRQVTSGDWYAALNNLRDFKDKYPTRRNKEADLLASWLEK